MVTGVKKEEKMMDQIPPNFFCKKLVLNSPEQNLKTEFENMHQKPHNLHLMYPVNHLLLTLLCGCQACSVTKLSGINIIIYLQIVCVEFADIYLQIMCADFADIYLQTRTSIKN